MTIYYVNPFTGNNANSGTGAWANAWRYLPGNGTAILPGDEVRYAKSEKRTTTRGYTNSATQINLQTNMTTAEAAVISVEATWTADALYATAAYRGCTLLANKTIPAGTKLAWYASTLHTSTIYRSIYATLELTNMVASGPGEGYRVALCSDTAGNTPVIWLEFGTVPTGTQQVHAAAGYDHGSLMSLSIASVALYKGSLTQTTTATNAQLTIYAYVVLMSASSWKDVIMPIGAAFEFPTATADTPPYVFPAPDVRAIDKCWYYPSGGNVTAYYAPFPSNRIAPYEGQVLNYYMPIPLTTGNEVNQQHSLLSFSGTAVSPIVIRGGFDPATDIQDGYTNMNPGVSYFPRWGAFCFTNGNGDYLEFERILCQLQPLMSFYQATTAQVTINSLKLRKCVAGASCYNQRPWALISVTSTNNNFYLAYLSATESIVSNAFYLVHRGHTNDYSSWSAGALRYGLIEFFDSISGPGAYTYISTSTNGGVQVLTGIRIIGSAPNKAGLAMTDTTSYSFAYMNVLAYAWHLEVVNAVWYTEGQSATIAEGQYGATTTVKATAAFTNVVTSGYGFGFTLRGFKTATVNGLTAGKGTTYGSVFSIESSSDPTYIANNPTVSASFTGDLGTTQAGTSSGPTLSFRFMKSISLAGMNVLDNGNKAPSLAFISCSNPSPIVIENAKFSVLHFDYHVTSYTQQPSWYSSPTPDVYGYTIRNCHCTMVSTYPVGWVRAEGCTFYGGDTMPLWWAWYTGVGTEQRTTRYALAGAILGFGCSLVGNILAYDTYQGNTTSTCINSTVLGRNRVGMLTGLQATCTYQLPLGTSYEYGSNLIYATPSSTITVGTGTTNRYPLFLRSIKGWTNKTGGTGLSSLVATTPNAYDAYDLTFSQGLFLGRIALAANVNIAITVVVRSATVNVFRMTVSPSREYSTVLSGHVMYKSVRSVNTDITYSFNIAATGEGTADIFVYAASTLTIRSFSVVAS